MTLKGQGLGPNMFGTYYLNMAGDTLDVNSTYGKWHMGRGVITWSRKRIGIHAALWLLRDPRGQGHPYIFE